MKIIFSYLLILLGLFFSDCKKDDLVTVDPPVSNCEDIAIIDADQYINGPADEFFWQSASIDGDCLKLVVRYGGGCEEVDFKLYDSSAIMESFPLQRNIRISLDDDDFCEALVTQELSYDLTPLQVEGYSKIILNLQGFDESLTYNY